MNSFIKSAPITKGILIFILIVFAFLFSSAVRLTWVYWADNMIDGNVFKWNNEFMVTTNDSYFWAEGARDLILCDRDNASMGEYYQQNCHQENDLSPVNDPLPKITHFLYDILPFSLETIIFYLPVFAASLLVIPFILIGSRFNLLLSGFIASLIAVVSTSYYSRTVVGYYDTDIFNLFFPMMIVWSLALAVETRAKPYVLLTALEMAVYRWCYPQSYAIEFAFCGLIVVYIIYVCIMELDVKFDNDKKTNVPSRVPSIVLCIVWYLKIISFYLLAIISHLFWNVKNSKNVFNYQLLSIMLISMIEAPFVIKIAAIAVLYLIIFRIKVDKAILFILACSAVAFLITGGFEPIINRLDSFIFQRDGTVDYSGLQFFSVAQTIVEAQNIVLKDIPLRLNGSILLFIISIIGYGWLCIRRPVMLLMLPLLGLGFLSIWGGLRFVMYAIPVIAIGMGFFIFRDRKSV
ncbi:MAG: hypothetical protein LBP40_02695, partial [Campylobacteraceae bacterium]|nr:hypothetical protein [Campylobacteraceae bacterium]